MRVATIGAIASTSATLLLTLNSWPVQAQGIVPAADGTGTQVTPNGPDYTITGGSTAADNQNLFHRFTDFNLLTGESATFLTQPEILNILSGVTGNNPSIIDGLLQVSGSNANLFLINPNGILFGPNSALNLQGSFTASTANQVNFADGLLDLAGTSDYATLVGPPQSFGFTLENPASVVNAGNLTVPVGESVMLLGGQVLNTGTLTAPGGEVVISAVEGGNWVRIAQSGSLLNLELATVATEATGAMPFSPLTLPELLTGSAIALAESVTINADGSIQLGEATVEATPASAIVSGAIEVAALTGGQVLTLGRDLTLTHALINASGQTAGGTVRIGGDYQGQGRLPRAQTAWLDAHSTIQADALDTGHGGEVIVWADGTTLFQGLITARGGPNGGDGGLVETSGRQAIDIDGGQVDASATQGTAGLWFVDPNDINIDADLALTIENALAGGTNFTASTIEGDPADATGVPGNGDIFLNSAIAASATNNATLTLIASRYIQGNDGAFISITGGNLVLKLNQEGLAVPTNPTINDAFNIISFIDGATEIHLGPGTYQEPDTIFLGSDVLLQGSGAANTIIDASRSGPISVSISSSFDDALPTQINDLTIANSVNRDGDGGAISNFGNLIINNSIIRNNQASGRGGGIANIRSTPTFSPAEGTLVINNSTIRNNRSGGDGGGISNAGGTVTINRSTIHNNIAGDDGGGVDNNNDGGTVTLRNSTLVDNVAAGEGGGVENDSTMAIANSTIVGNQSATGGGISNTLNGSTLTLTSSLVSGNTATSGSGNNVFNGGSLTGGNNLFGANNAAGVLGFSPAASDIVPAVPLGAIISTTLADNGGPTQTLALVAGSPAINAGSGSDADQRGFSIIGIRDIGAFEFQQGSGGSDLGEGDNFDCLAGDCNPLTLPPETSPQARRSNSEPSYVQQFEEHLGVEASAFEDIDALNRARNITGVTPALIYASFVPPSEDLETATTEETLIADARAAQPRPVVNDMLAQQIVAQAEGRQERTTALANEDVLQLVLVTADNTPRRINTGATRSEVLAAARQLQIELTDRTRRRLDNYLMPSQALYRWLVAPLEETLAEEDIGHISFVLDEGLRSLPLAALHDGEKFIIETYSVGLMPSLSLTDTRIGNIRNASVLAMGASEFSDQPPLPAVPLEIATIGDLRVSDAYLNEAFTPETLVTQRSEEAYPILHLATHGQFTSGELSNSYIQFWDRRLGLDELPQLQLGDPAVELMVLSACRTVLGDSEAELGFAGLAIKSGAKSAIAALWQVSDLETAGLMAELYTQMGQVTYKGAALREAQLAMLRGDVVIQDDQLVWSGGSEPLPDEFSGLGFADTSHPYYWAAFTLVGNPW
ncbi:CHAT domain-containing protein [Leptolyngbya iicbica]|nr:CHAT domain-containing protein [Leptolyngbya sp. LK]